MTQVIETPLDRLMAEAEKRGWRDVDLCSRLQISPQRLNNWKNRGLPLDGAALAASKLRLSLDSLWFGKTPHVAQQPAAYTVATARHQEVIALFDELTPQQQDTIVGELLAHVEANRAVLQHYSGRPPRHVADSRIESTFGLPDRINTKAGT